MSSSPERLALPELRTGQWTRLGTDAVLGDTVTEQTLSTLAESTRVAAGSQGYAVGWAEGQRAARAAAALEAEEIRTAHALVEARRETEHAAAVAALNEAARQLDALLREVCAEVEDRASTLAWELTQELVGHELAGPGIDVVRRVLALAPTEEIVRVRLHPADLGAAAPLLEVPAVGDPSLDRGDALVETATHVLDLRLEAALARVREALR